MIKDLCFEIIETCPNNCLFCSSCSDIGKTRIIDISIFKKSHYVNNYMGLIKN